MIDNLRTLVRYRGLIQSLVARDLKARYRGSMLGFFWSFVNPLLLLLIYNFVFTYLLQNRAEGTQPYAVFMFTALLPWTWFQSSLNEATGSLISGGNLIKKVLFPAEVLPIVTILSNMVHFLFGLPILVAFMIYYQVVPDWAELPWFLVVLLVQFIFTLALALILSALAVHFRDVKDLVSNLLTFWFFATPIIYSYKQFPDFKFYFDLNPFTHLAISYQELLFFPGPFGHKWWLLAMGAGSVVLFFAAYWLFDRLRDSFAEAV
ncbi:MAG: ABC transporter permease [Acidobacteria bacterium]|nr:ABC transporter permease [Acidobacteriota bacterium]